MLEVLRNWSEVFITPVVYSITFYALALFSKSEKKRKLYLFVGLALQLFFSNEYLVDKLMYKWEHSSPNIVQDNINQQYDIGVLLGGGMHQRLTNSDLVRLNEGGDRIMQAIQLYQKGKIQKIIVSGGFGTLDNMPISEAESMRDALLIAGVPNEDIILENRSLNTYENALFVSYIIHENFKENSVVLITSAYHSRRAAACFKKQGVYPAVFLADVKGVNRQFEAQHLIRISEESNKKWRILLREWLGFLGYILADYC